MHKILLLLILSSFSFTATAEVFTSSYMQALQSQEFKNKMAKIGEELTETDRTILTNANQALAEKMKNPGLAVGSKAPDFDLTNAFGAKFSLNKATSKGPVILVFYRGAWCPYCNLHLKVLQESLPAFKKHKAQLVLVTPQKPDKSVEQFKQDANQFEVLSDLDYSVAKKFNLYFDLSPDVVAVYKRIGIDLESYNGDGRTGLPVPGTLVIDQSGVILAAHAETNYSKRMEPEAILKALSKIEN